MNKIIRISVPIMIAFLFISILLWLVDESNQVSAAPSISTPEGSILVTTLQDELNTDGDCSLREAITAANENSAIDACPAGDALITDTITFDVAGTLFVTNPLTVTEGGWLVIDGTDVITISGGGSAQILYVSSGANLNLMRASLANGSANYGGGIYNLGALFITDSTLVNNKVTNTDTWYGGDGGGIYNRGILTITNSILSGNISFGSFGLTAEGGGGIYNAGFLSITNSVLSSNSTDFNGGGILNNGEGKLSITNSILSGNYAGEGGGIYSKGILTITDSTLSGNITGNNSGRGGGICSIDHSGPVKIINSVITGNQSPSGGGIYNEEVMMITNSLLISNSASSGGGIMTTGGYITITGSTLSENSAFNGGGINNLLGSVSIINSILLMNEVGDYGLGGGIYNRGYLYLSDSTVSLNKADAHLGSGGGIYNSNETVVIDKSTLSDNYASLDGGAINNGGNYGSVTVNNSTISGNYAGNKGGAILNWGVFNVINSSISGNYAFYGAAIDAISSLTAINTIVAYNSQFNCNHLVADGGHNISSDNSCGFDPANDSMPNTDPLLGPLQDNGGLTWTHSLEIDSPAIDAGDNAQCPSIDQRGVPRPMDGDGDGLAFCDVGSYEYSGPPTQRLILTLVIKVIKTP